MKSAIEAAAVSHYPVQMRSAFLRLLAFFAVMLMPLGMAAAPAAPLQHQQMAMPMEHCPEPDSTHHSTGALADCTMACASALPAADLEIVDARTLARFTPQPALIAAMTGIELEIATPPPRWS